jgi:hypothetical protein
VARAAEPPSGWEEPPPLPVKAPVVKSGKPRMPACCADDPTCCARQAVIDGAAPGRAGRVVVVRLADLPESVLKEAPKEGPFLEGVPPLRIIDGGGQPAPWPDTPKGEIRVIPPGRYGEIRWKDNWEPFFAPPQYRSMGYGVVHQSSARNSDRGRAELTGSVRFTSIDQGEGDKLRVDLVTGTLDGTPDLRATLWSHVEAVPVFEDFVHAYRGKPFPEQEKVRSDDGKEPAPQPDAGAGDAGDAGAPAAVKDAEMVTFVLPEVILDFNSKDTRVAGGFFPSRFSRSVSFTTYSMPIGPGRGGLATFTVRDFLANRWFKRSARTGKAPESLAVVLATSQTSAEAEPSVRVVIFGDDKR